MNKFFEEVEFVYDGTEYIKPDSENETQTKTQIEK